MGLAVCEPARSEFNIGDLAKAASVSIDTIRFYEKERLLNPAYRRSSGYRVYTVQSLRELTLIRRARLIGFSLPEIRELMRAYSGGQPNCAHVRNQIRAKIRAVDERLQELQLLRNELHVFVQKCERELSRAADGPPARCTFLETLSSPHNHLPAKAAGEGSGTDES